MRRVSNRSRRYAERYRPDPLRAPRAATKYSGCSDLHGSWHEWASQRSYRRYLPSRPRIPASCLIWFIEPRAPESAIIDLILLRQVLPEPLRPLSVVACQMAMVWGTLVVGDQAAVEQFADLRDLLSASAMIALLGRDHGVHGDRDGRQGWSTSPPVPFDGIQHLLRRHGCRFRIMQRDDVGRVFLVAES